MTTLAPRPAAPTRTRRDWWIPASLLALALIPSVAGAARLVDLSGGRTEENARFFDLPEMLALLGRAPSGGAGGPAAG